MLKVHLADGRDAVLYRDRCRKRVVLILDGREYLPEDALPNGSRAGSLDLMALPGDGERELLQLWKSA